MTEIVNEQCLVEAKNDSKRMGVYLLIGPIAILLDAEDYERVASKRWTLIHGGRAIQSRVKIDGKNRKVNLARFIMNAFDGGPVLQRKDAEAYDFRKLTLIKCENMQHRQSLLGKRRQNTTSRYKGVSRCKRTGVWRASIRPAGASLYLGSFATEREAAIAYDRAARFYFGPSAFQNFSDSRVVAEEKIDLEQVWKNA